MRRLPLFSGLLLILTLPALCRAAGPVEKIRNEQVVVMQQTLAPGESLAGAGEHPRVLVYVDAGTIEPGSTGSKPQTVKKGESIFQAARSGGVRNAGSADLRIVWVEFPGKGGAETWGTTGLAPNYKLLFENNYARVYDIKMAAGGSEPQHTHHARIVVCLSGAELEHEMPDGRRENSSLKTDEIAWRGAATHVGHNLGKTDLWVIAIEPK